MMAKVAPVGQGRAGACRHEGGELVGEFTGTGCTGTIGGDMFTMGETAISPSSVAHLKDCCNPR